MKSTKNLSNLHTNKIHPSLPWLEEQSNGLPRMLVNKVAWRHFWKMVRLFRALLPAPDGLPVRIRITDNVPDERMADTSRYSKQYLIRLKKDLSIRSPELAFTLLVHEWAHVLTWGVEHEHGDEWGLELARCWRLLTGEFFPGGKSNED